MTSLLQDSSSWKTNKSSRRKETKKNKKKKRQRQTFTYTHTNPHKHTHTLHSSLIEEQTRTNEDNFRCFTNTKEVFFRFEKKRNVLFLHFLSFNLFVVVVAVSDISDAQKPPPAPTTSSLQPRKRTEESRVKWAPERPSGTYGKKEKKVNQTRMPKENHFHSVSYVC